MVAVTLDDGGVPGTLLLAGRRYAVTAVEERWRVVDGWWRADADAVARTYVRLRLDDERVLTLFHDDRYGPHDGWYSQRY
jgi:hypothetical protein